jgi:WD40 repeat protein
MKASVVRGLIVILALCATSMAGSVPLPVVLTNDDNPQAGANSATAYHLVTSNGTMTFLKKLSTGGTGLGGGYLANTGTSIQSNGNCVFVVNTGSDTISSFAAPNYTKTGDAGIPGMFSTFGFGGSIALAPNGKLLVSGNSGTLNISTWSVAANCKLTHLADYTPSIGPDYFSAIAFNPAGTAVVVPAPDYEGVELFKVNTNGTLTDINNVDWTGVAACINGCYPAGMDFTNDGKVIVFGNASIAQSSVLTVNVGQTGLFSPQSWDLSNAANVGNPNVPWFSKTGAAGSGPLYVGFSGYGPNNIASGEVTASFTESPLSITYTNSTAITTPQQYLGGIRTIGSLMVVAIFPNLLQTAQVNADGSLTMGPTTTDANGAGLLSISVYPNSR